MIDIYKIPTDEAESGDWILWHKAVKKQINRDCANMAFAAAAKKHLSYSANNEELRKYLDKNGYVLEADAIDQTFRMISAPLRAWSTYMKILGIVLLIVVIATIIFIVKNPKTAAKIGAAAITKNPGVLAS